MDGNIHGRVYIYKYIYTYPRVFLLLNYFTVYIAYLLIRNK